MWTVLLSGAPAFDGQSDLTLLWDTLTWQSCGTLLLDALVGHSYMTLLLDTLARYSYLTLLQDTKHKFRPPEKIPSTPGRQPPDSKSPKNSLPTTPWRQPPNAKCETDFPQHPLRAGETKILTSQDAFLWPCAGKTLRPKPRSKPPPYSHRKNPTVWPHCLGNKGKVKEK